MRSVILDGTDLERDGDAPLKLWLTYDGPLLSSKPLDKDHRDKRIEHKHDIRRKFHRQLKEFWSQHQFLKACNMEPQPMFDILPDKARVVWADEKAQKRSLPEILGRVYGHSGYNFVPLVWQENSVACSLRILCLRRDGPDAVLAGRDIDNRVKTLIDALTMPLPKQGPPLKDGKPLLPQDGEDPFFVLLDDDRQITHLEVQTETALELDEASTADESYTRLFISVEIRPVVTTMFNLSFA